VFLDLLEGKPLESSQTGGLVDIHVDLETLAGLADVPGELAGYGPVIADIARQVAADQEKAEWRYTVTDPDGELVSVGTTRRRPTAAQKRWVQAQNPTCVFPGCRMPAVGCDLDHTRRHVDGGPTTEANLEPACRHDHRVKDEGDWKLRRIRPGAYEWASPIGHTYITSGRSP